MRKNLTEIVFILDRSGSMAGLERDTIGGFNAMIEKQKREPGEALISTVLFDNENEVIHDRVPLEQVQPMTENLLPFARHMASVGGSFDSICTGYLSDPQQAEEVCRHADGYISGSALVKRFGNAS